MQFFNTACFNTMLERIILAPDILSKQPQSCLQVIWKFVQTLFELFPPIMKIVICFSRSSAGVLPVFSPENVVCMLNMSYILLLAWKPGQIVPLSDTGLHK